MKQKSRLTEREHEHEHAGASLDKTAMSRARPIEFATPEEALRSDLAQIEVPDGVTARLAQSVRAESSPAPPERWWHRWFHR